MLESKKKLYCEAWRAESGRCLDRNDPDSAEGFSGKSMRSVRKRNSEGQKKIKKRERRNQKKKRAELL